MARSIHPWLGKARSSRAPRFENTCDQDGSIFPIGGQVSECTYPRSHRGSTRERVGLRNEIEAKGKGDGVERVAGPSSPSSSSLRRETKLRRRVPRLNVTVSVEEGLLPFEEDRIERYRAAFIRIYFDRCNFEQDPRNVSSNEYYPRADIRLEDRVRWKGYISQGEKSKTVFSRFLRIFMKFSRERE